MIFLDEEQLNAVDDSEPNYIRVAISAGCYPVTLDNGESLSMCSMYRTRHGVIAPNSATLGPFHDATKMTPQREAITELLNTERELAEILGVNSYDEFRDSADQLFEKFTSVLADLDLMRPDGLRVAESNAYTYGEIESTFNSGDGGALPHLKLILSTPRVVARQGESIVQLSPQASAELGRPKHVALVRRIEKRQYATQPQEIRVIAAVQEIANGKLGEGAAAVDQILRHALGLEVREKALVYPVDVPRAGAGLVAPRRYAVMRVQVADINIVEQQACFMPQAELDLLGISSGDVVVLEGCVPAPSDTRRSGYDVASVRLKAYVASPELLSQRERNSGGGFNARYPSARDALGVYPDLPWVFLDAGSRELLGVGKLGVVRIRAGRGYQLSKELRELMVLLLIASVGASTQISNVWVASTLFAVATIVSVFVVLLRMRVRLSVPPTSTRRRRGPGTNSSGRTEVE